MKFGYLVVIFLFLNFGGLALGSALMGEGPSSSWYLSLQKAPWTPPGWVFGAAWTTIMICFSIYMAYFFKSGATTFKIALFAVLWLLNVSWNYIFFNQHLVLTGLIVLVLLTFGIVYLFVSYWSRYMKKQLLVLPYVIWLFIAFSLNLYVFLYN